MGRRLGGDTWRGVPSFHQRRILSYWFANLLEKIDVKTSVGSWMCSCGDLRTGRLLCAGCWVPGAGNGRACAASAHLNTDPVRLSSPQPWEVGVTGILF